MKAIVLALCLFALVAWTTADPEEQEENKEVERIMNDLAEATNEEEQSEKKCFLGLFCRRRRRRRRRRHYYYYYK